MPILPASGGAANVPNATTTVVGKVRLATTVEATTGTATDIAVTPAGLNAALSGIVGGMTYKGFFDAVNAVPDLSNAQQGDFYKISAAGIRYGKEWAVGDHLVVNADMNGTIDGSKLDKIDSTESISNLNDLGDVTLNAPSGGQGLVFNAGTAQWVNSAIVEGIDDLSDAALTALTSTSYSNSTTSAALVNLRDHITEVTTGQTAVRTIPTTLTTDNLLLVSNIGSGEVELRVSGAAVFWVAGAASTTPITIPATTRATLTGLLRAGVVTWSVSQAAISPRQSLTRIGSADWTNGYINAYDVQGVASQGEINNLQAELNATQTGAGLSSDGTYVERTGSNYLNSSTSLYSADTLLDGALKSEATARASADSTLQSNINSEASTRASADSTLQSNINSEASTRASADSTLQSNINSEASTRASADSTLQSELNTTQTGAGLSSTGAYTARTGSNYLDSSTSLYSADTLLDGALKAVSDQVDLLGTQIVSSVNGIAPVEGDVTLTATDISGFATVATSGAYADLSGLPALVAVATSGAADDVSVAHTAINYTAVSADVEAHLAGIDVQLGVGLVNSVNDVLPVGGNVTLTAADITGFATVATSGAYSDLSGTPALSTVATSGAYSDLSGTPALSTVATSGAYSDLSGLPTLVAVAGSGEAADVNVVANPANYTATSPDVEAHLSGIDAVLGTLGGDLVTSVNSVEPVLGNVTLNAVDIDSGFSPTAYAATSIDLDGHLSGINTSLGNLFSSAEQRLYANTVYVNAGTDDVQDGIDAVTVGNQLVWVSTGGYSGSTVLLDNKNLIKVRAEGCGTGAFGIVELESRGLTISGAESTRNLVQGFQVEGLTVINGTLGRHAFIDCQLLGGLTITNGTQNFVTVRDCDLTGTLTISAGVTATIYLVQCNLTGLTISNSASASQLIIANCSGVPLTALSSATIAGQSGFADGSFRTFLNTATLPNALSFTGRTSELLNNANFITSAQAPVQSVNALTGAITLNGANLTSAHTAVNYTAATSALNSHLSGIDTVLGTLGESTVVSVNGIAPVLGDVTVTAADITGFATVATSGAYSDLSGTPALSTVATSGAYSDLSGTPALSTVATSGAYSDLSGTPALGTSAAQDTGTGVGDVVQLVDIGAGVAGLPAIDASLITGLDYTNLTNVPTSFISSLQYVTDQNPLLLQAGIHYIMANATDTLKVLTVPSSANGGDIIRITNWGLGRLKLTTGGGNTTFLLSGLNVVGGATAGEVFVESKCTVDLVGFDYAPADLLPAWGVYFISSIEINTKGLTTSGQAIVYNATTGKLEGGDAGDFASAYTPANYTIADAKFDSHFAGVDTELGSLDSTITTLDGVVVKSVNGLTPTAGAVTLSGADIDSANTPSNYTAASAQLDAHFTGIDTALGLKAATADVLLRANNLSDLGSASTARTNLGLGTAALADTGTSAGNVVVLSDVGGTVKLPAVDGSLLTNVFAAPPTYESKSANFTAVVDYHYSVSAASGNITCTLPARSGVSLGKQIRFKLYNAANDLILTPAAGDTIDGLASYTLGNPKQSITLVRGANDWEIL